jgi:hypothetical protein
MTTEKATCRATTLIDAGHGRRLCPTGCSVEGAWTHTRTTRQLGPQRVRTPLRGERANEEEDVRDVFQDQQGFGGENCEGDGEASASFGKLEQFAFPLTISGYPQVPDKPSSDETAHTLAATSDYWSNLYSGGIYVYRD